MNRWHSLLILTLAAGVALVALIAAGELYFRPEDANPAFGAFMLALTAGGMALLAHLYTRDRSHALLCQTFAEEAAGDVREYAAQAQSLQVRVRTLQQRLDVLTTTDNLSKAAGRFSTLSDFLNEIARLVRDMSGARDLTVFLLDGDNVPVPRVYYQLGETTELCLSLSEEGGRTLAELIRTDPQRDSVIEPESLSVDKIEITPESGHLVVSAGLRQAESPIGSVRLRLLHYGPERASESRLCATLLAREMTLARLNGLGLNDALGGKNAWHYDSRSNTADIAAPLAEEKTLIGAIKMRFDLHGVEEPEAAIRSRQAILAESARHLAKIIHHERIYEQAIKDGMTGLFNKRHMLAQLETHLHISRRHRKKLAVVMLDIDHFKKVNDTYGHLTGDLVLKEVAGILLRAVRESDFACRYGGEELAVILPECDEAAAHELAERLRKTIESHPFVTDKGESMTVTASLGVSELDATMNRAEDLIQHADRALYSAKHGGRNRVVAASRLAAGNV